MIGRRKLGILDVSAIGFGCMSLTPIYGVPDPEEAIATLHRAPDLGIDFIDTSDAYGANGANEELVGRALKGRREKYILATKFGNIRLPDGKPGAKGDPDYVIEACEKSLKRLGTDTIDLYFIHRIDDTVPIEDTVGAMVRLKTQGKIRHLGISEAGASTIRRAHKVHPMAALQTEYSLWTRDVEPEILPLAHELGIGFVAYAPLGRGFLTGTVTTGDTTFAETAAAVGCNATAPGCADTVMTTLSVDEIVYGTATTTNGQTTVVVRRATKGSAPQEATIASDAPDQLETGAGTLFPGGGREQPPPAPLLTAPPYHAIEPSLQDGPAAAATTFVGS